MYLKERVLENRAVGYPGQRIYKLVLSGQIAKEAKPGQFVHIQVADAHDPLLRRPLSIAAIDADKEQITVYYRVAGRGTDLLTRIKDGEYISVLGPFGNGFTIPSSGELLLIAGGIGIFPLLSLIQAVDTERVRVKLLWGGENKEFLASAGLAYLPAGALEVQTATLDGSHGVHGLVTDLLATYTPPATGSLQAASCGPKGMLKAVSQICEQKKIALEVSLEEHMACGVGACLGCVCTVRKDDGSPARKRVCKEGPVFNSTEVIWDE